MTETNYRRPDLVAAWATGSGIGLIALMLIWLIGNRLISLMVGPPAGPTIAFVGAMLAGIAVSIRAGKRLAAVVERERT